MTDFARGDRLLELREQRRMSRESVAHEIGVTTKSLYEWEKRSGPIKWVNAQALASFYEIANPEDLVTRDPEATGPSSRGQVGEGFDEFREYVAGLNQKLDAGQLERAAIEQAVATQNLNLATQTEVLERISSALGRIETALADLPTVAAGLTAVLQRLETAGQSERQAGGGG